jgi:hypothetical protein
MPGPHPYKEKADCHAFARKDRISGGLCFAQTSSTLKKRILGLATHDIIH